MTNDAERPPRGDYPTAGMRDFNTKDFATKDAHDTRPVQRLARLADLDDFEIADGEPDIRGWTVKTKDGMDIGKIDDVIADPVLRKVQYLEVKVKRDLLGTTEDEHILVPIGVARLNDEDDVVTLRTIGTTGVNGIPRFGSTPFTSENERILWTHYYGDGSTIESGADDPFFGIRRQGREASEYLTISSEHPAVVR